ncbi:MAG TPA: prepilin-type N-terminal cleavage/methylation domain-containing protein [Candidatus Didemnitutus sp.]|nr:prepilin-type N-terminal cleavage/methylation domain-containing protein [Candidatus Didemnitutus sp.]
MISPRKRAAAFTLVEVLIGATLSAIVMVGVLTSFVFLGRSLSRLVNYQNLEAKSRQAMTVMRTDFGLALSVKSGTTPTATAVTLTLPSGDVTYTYDSSSQSLRRQATFGANRDYTLLQNDTCVCTSFAFSYYTTTNGSPVSQITAGTNVPFSIKQIQVSYSLDSTGSASPQTRASYDMGSATFLLRNRWEPDGN